MGSGLTTRTDCADSGAEACGWQESASWWGLCSEELPACVGHPRGEPSWALHDTSARLWDVQDATGGQACLQQEH